MGGDGPKLVRELFRVADDLSPTIVFIDEIDAVGSKRYDSQSGGTREIQFPLPDIKTKRHIFNIHTGRMSLGEDVDLETFVMAKDELSGADIKAVCTEAGLLALRERRMKVTQDDFVKAKEKVS